MSHWRQFKQEVLKRVEKVHLEKALKDMGLGIDYSVKTVSNAYGTAKVDCALTRDREVLPIGFNMTKVGDETYSLQLQGDFWATGLREQTFMNELAQLYQKHKIVDTCLDQGWTLDQELENIKVNNKGEIELTFEKSL